LSPSQKLFKIQLEGNKGRNLSDDSRTSEGKLKTTSNHFVVKVVG